jgi:hypothetical protein
VHHPSAVSQDLVAADAVRHPPSVPH